MQIFYNKSIIPAADFNVVVEEYVLEITAVENTVGDGIGRAVDGAMEISLHIS